MKQPMWIIGAGNLVGAAAVVLGIALVSTGAASAWWLVGWLAFHLFGSLMLSVGLHRYFSHGSFKTSMFWHRVMAYSSVLLLNGSPLGWATAHMTHHVHSDGPGDPHYAKWPYAVWKQYRSVNMVKRRLRRIVSDPTVRFVHRHGTELWLAFVALVALISPTALLFLYLMPLGSTHLIGSAHQLLSHRAGQPRDLPWMEFILPACGEWHHATHHENAKLSDLRTKWWHVDLGAAFIRAIRV